MTDWHCCMPGHAWGDDGWCVRCGAYEPEKRIKKVEYASPQELAGFALRMVVERINFRIDAMNERGLSGVSISKGFAQEIVRACQRGSELLENPEPAKAGVTAGAGSGSANVSEGVTGGGESAVGDAAGETGGHLQPPPVDDPAASGPCAMAGLRLSSSEERLMLGNNVNVTLREPNETVSGELRQQTVEGVWVYFGWAEQATVHFYPQHRIVEIVDRGRTYR